MLTRFYVSSIPPPPPPQGFQHHSRSTTFRFVDLLRTLNVTRSASVSSGDPSLKHRRRDLENTMQMPFNSLAPGRCGSISQTYTFLTHYTVAWTLAVKLTPVYATRLHWWLVIIGSGNGFVFTWANFDPYLGPHRASLGHNDLSYIFFFNSWNQFGNVYESALVTHLISFNTMISWIS